jgi:hypothetical protein
MRVMRTIRRSFGRTLAAVVAVVAAIAGGQTIGLFTSRVSAADTSVPLGTAQATAQTYKVNPQTGALSLGIAFGVTLTNYQNKVAIAEARGIDLGIIGQLLAAEGCDGGDPTLAADKQPQPVHVEARNDQTDVSDHGTDVSVFEKTVHATNQPFADSIVTTAPAGIPGAVEIGPGRSESISRWLSDGRREAIATTDISSVKLGPAAAPVAELKGLHWEVHRVTGAQESASQTFTIGSLNIGGTAIPTNDPTAAFKALNGVLNGLGLELVAPQSREGAGFYYVDPLKIGVVPNKTRDGLLSSVLEGLREPVREPLVNFLVNQDCGNKTYVTVADVVVGSISGAGALELELGGVHASSGDFTTFSFPGLPALPSLTDVLPPAVLSNDFSTAPAPVSALTNTPSVRRVQQIAPAAATLKKGTRGGALAAASAVGLGLIALMVELDRRKMRAAQRLAYAEVTGD